MSVAAETFAPSYDLLDPHFYDDPWAAYRRLRDEAPLYRDPKNGIFAVSRYDDVVEVAKQPDLYCSGKGVRPIVLSPMSILTLDGAEHARQRRFVSQGFTPSRVQALDERIRAITHEVLSGIEDRGEIDFVRDFAVHVPLIVIAELLGFDVASRMKLAHWSDDMMAGEGRPLDDPRVQKAGTAFFEFVGLCQEVIQLRREEPRNDLVSLLTAKHDAGEFSRAVELYHLIRDELVDDQLIMFLVTLLAAGNETTRNTIVGGLLGFSMFPAEREKLRTNPALLDSAVEEILRWTCPALGHSRTVTRDHVFQGTTLREGDKVLMLWQSANRDERVFSDPDTFLIDRDPNPHLSFGLGAHFCLGANLARLEIRIVFEELFRRLRDIRIPEGERPSRDEQAMFLAYDRVTAIFTPVARDAT